MVWYKGVPRVWPVWSEPTVRMALFFASNLEGFKPEHQKALKDGAWSRRTVVRSIKTPELSSNLASSPKWP